MIRYITRYRAVALAAAVVTLGACSRDRLLGVTDPDIIAPDNLNSADGAEGLRVVHDGRAEDFPAEAAAVRDTTGAGDACLGGCLHALAAGAAVPEAVRQGLAAARRCVGVLGAR